jgi:hypothetical protein
MIRFSKSLVLSLIILLTVSGCDLGIDDGRFSSGKGNVSGIVVETAPEADTPGVEYEYEVNWVGADEVVRADKDGKFLIESIPSGHQEIIIRKMIYEGENLVPSVYSDRVPVRIVSGMTTDLGRLTLEKAEGFFKVLVMDPYLEIEDAKVIVSELPGEVVYTGVNGIAPFYLPPKGEYTFIVTHSLFDFLPAKVTKDWEWEHDPEIYIVPDGNNNHNRLYHAFYRMQKALEPVQGCDSADQCCIRGDWWKTSDLLNKQAPCPYPIKKQETDTDDIECVGSDSMPLVNIVHAIRKHEIIQDLNLDGMDCSNLLNAELNCEENRCRYAKPEYVLNHQRIDYGKLEELTELDAFKYGTGETMHKSLIESERDLSGLPSFSEGIISDDCLSNPNCYYLFVAMYSDSIESPIIVFISDHKEQSTGEIVYTVYMQSDIYPRSNDCITYYSPFVTEANENNDKESSYQYGIKCEYSWSLFKIEFNLPLVIANENLAAKLAWLNAVEQVE